MAAWIGCSSMALLPSNTRSMRHLAALGVFTLTWLAVSTSVLAQGPLAATSFLLQNFERMVFDERLDPLPWSAFRRWREEVRAVIVGDKGMAYSEQVRHLFRDFEALTGVGFTLSEADSAATLEIVFAGREWYRNATARTFPEPEQVQCFSNTTTGHNGWIQSAFVVIPDDLSRRAVETCLAHELMHVLGFAGHPTRTFNSALRNGRAAETLTTNDLLLIRTFYDPTITPSMGREDLMVAVRGILTELRNEVGRSDDPMEVLAQRHPLQLWWMTTAPV